MARSPQIVDTVMSRELQLFADNTHKTYMALLDNYVPNLLKKAWKGVYDHEKAIKLLEYYVRMYVIPEYIRTEHMPRGTKVSDVANGATIRHAAKYFADSIKDLYIDDAIKENDRLIAQKAAQPPKGKTLSGTKRRTLSPDDAIEILLAQGLDFKENYFALNGDKRRALLDVADRMKNKPRSTSTGRSATYQLYLTLGYRYHKHPRAYGHAGLADCPPQTGGMGDVDTIPALPKFDDMHVSGGGFGDNGKYSHSVHFGMDQRPSMVYIAPVKLGNGRHRGYVAHLTAAPGTSGLWSTVDPDGSIGNLAKPHFYTTPRKAYAAIAAFWKRHTPAKG
jgi:hypothetical protein